MVIFREVPDQGGRQGRQVARRRIMLWIRQATGIFKIRMRHAQFAGLVCHLAGKGFFTARQTFRHDNRCIIAGLNNDSPQQIFDPHPCIDPYEHLGPARFPGLLADRKCIVQRQGPILQLFKGQIGSHQLGHGGGIHFLVFIFARQHCARLEVDQNHLFGFGIKLIDIALCSAWLHRHANQKPDRQKKRGE